jgi:hypothetical protein
MLDHLGKFAVWVVLFFIVLRIAESYAVVYTSSRKDDRFLKKLTKAFKEFFKFG